ncbi:MAG TPA: hypothetical protein VIT18_02075 [Terrimicrobiaceae bacterium]
MKQRLYLSYMSGWRVYSDELSRVVELQAVRGETARRVYGIGFRRAEQGGFQDLHVAALRRALRRVHFGRRPLS